MAECLCICRVCAPDASTEHSGCVYNCGHPLPVFKVGDVVRRKGHGPCTLGVVDAILREYEELWPFVLWDDGGESRIKPSSLQHAQRPAPAESAFDLERRAASANVVNLVREFVSKTEGREPIPAEPLADREWMRHWVSTFRLVLSRVDENGCTASCPIHREFCSRPSHAEGKHAFPCRPGGRCMGVVDCAR